MKIVAAIAVTVCLLATPVAAGDATRFLVCRSEGCIDIPSLRFLPRTPGAAAPNVAAPQAPPPPQADALSREIEADIVAFCDNHPQESFCRKLALWFQKHPNAQR